MKSGYLYVLVHPSDPCLYKIGVTTRPPEKRLAMINSNYKACAGKIVKETGQKWKIKTYISVADPNFAKKVFWNETPFPLIPFRGGVEIERMEWELVQKGLDAAKKAGIRPPPKPRITPVRNHEWMLKQLEGSGIAMVGHYRGLVRRMEFQCEKGHVFKESGGLVAYRRKTCPVCDWEKEENDA